MRLFVALELTAEVRERLAAWGTACARADRALRPVPEDSLHVTLAFLGERPEEDLPALGAAVEGCGELPGPLALGAPLWLSPRRPHVLTVEVLGDVRDVYRRLLDGLRAAIGYEPERRELRPHVTVCRVRRGERPRHRDPLPEPLPAASFRAPAVALVRSHVGGGPARYETLVRHGL